MNLENVSLNQKRSKRKAFNEFKVVTDLVRKYKYTEKEEDLLAILKALEGIINTYTLILTPGDVNQQIYVTPYMKKFLGMFLTPEERSNPNYKSYNQAIARVRWIMRHYTYEDMYSKILEILIQAVKAMRIIGTCDCIYYIQMIVKYKLHDLVIKTGKDASVNLADIPTENDCEEESAEDVLDRLSFNPSNHHYEEDIIDQQFYFDVDLGVLTKTDDIYSCLGNYERYILYLYVGLNLKPRQIFSILKYEDAEELKERISDIQFKLDLIRQEEN